MNKEITIYELLGKIRNGEVPKKIIYRDYLCYYDDGDYKIKSVGEWLFANEYIDLSNLNDKVEIIEDNDKLEKMQDFDLTLKETNVTKDLELTYEGVSETFNYAWHKIDGIIDHINKIEEKLDEK